MIDIKNVNLTLKKRNLEKRFRAFRTRGNSRLDWAKQLRKTMPMKCICGIVIYKIREIRVNDEIIGKDVDMPVNVGVIIETPGFLPDYLGVNNLKFLAKIKNKVAADEIKTDRRTVMDYFLEPVVKGFGESLKEK